MRARTVCLGTVVLTLFLSLTALGTHAQGQVYGSVGLQVVPIASGELVVLQVVEGAPAEKGGIQAGDLIIQVDEKPLKGIEFSEIIKSYLWGPPGTAVRLTYMRPGVAGVKLSELKRVPLEGDVKPLPGVKMIQPGQ